MNNLEQESSWVPLPKEKRHLTEEQKTVLKGRIEGKIPPAVVSEFLGNAAYVSEQTLDLILNHSYEQNSEWLKRVLNNQEDKHLLTLLRCITGQTGDFTDKK